MHIPTHLCCLHSYILKLTKINILNYNYKAAVHKILDICSSRTDFTKINFKFLEFRLRVKILLRGSNFGLRFLYVP